jgi:DnaJ-class molecular chaperone
MGMQDPYQTLGVDANISPEELKKVYRKLAMQYHPDRNSGDAAAEAKFKEVSAAYEILSDPAKKQKWEYERQYSGANHTPHPFGGGHPFGDAFDSFFRGGFGPHFGGGFGSSNQRTTNVQLNIPLRDAFTGKKVPVQINLNGGAVNLVVNVPPGAETGERYKFTNAEVGNANVGDLIVTIQVQPETGWARNGADLLLVTEISLWAALAGTSGIVRTIDNTEIKLQIPPLSVSGTQLRLRGHGMPKNGNPLDRGDMIVRINAIMPKTLTEEQKRLILSWNDAAPLT